MSKLFESGYERFQCLGADCEATCCSGWRVDIDKETYHRYKRNRHPALRTLFQHAVKRNKDSGSDAAYGVMVLEENGDCPFMERGLCRIHALLGPQELSSLCATYPRAVNELAGQEEHSLYLSCPEAARLVLLQREGIQFTEQEGQSTGAASDRMIEPEKIQAISEIRALVIFVLQYREVSIETRLLMLGMLLEMMTSDVLPFRTESVARMPMLIDRVQQLLVGAKDLESQLAKIRTSEALHVRIFGGVVECLRKYGSHRFADCVQEAGKGLYLSSASERGEDDLSQRMSQAFERYYGPFFHENEYILENYLVHTVYQFVLPFRADEPLGQYRNLIINFLTIRLVLLGVAAYHKELTEESVIRVVSAFTRFSQHNQHYLPHLVRMLDEQGLTSFGDLFVLFAGGGRSPEARS